MLRYDTLIDFDGVIYDTEERIVKMKGERPDISWNEFFDQLDWYQLLEESKLINHSIEYILEAQERQKCIAILTKIHTLLEMQAKVDGLRSQNVTIPILFVPPKIQKSSIYLPQNGEVLIDDSIPNLRDWQQHGGKSLYLNFDSNSNGEFEVVKTLKKIL